MQLTDLYILLGALLFSLLVVPIASSVAIYFDLVDRPSIRKRHVGEVPLAGGMVLVAGLLISLIFLPLSKTVLTVTALSCPLFVLGVLDDKFDIPAKVRLFVQLGIGSGLVYSGILVMQLDALFGGTTIVLTPFVAVGFTLVCSCGVLNAINMADGIDGLLGSVASISLAAVAWLAFDVNAVAEAGLAMNTIGLLLGYLAYNLGVFGQKQRVFLGDSGSMVVGLVLLVLLIQLSQGENLAITPTSAGWLLGIPLLDTVSVMVRRISSGRSPFTAGRDHFHHVLQDLGISRKSTLRLLILAQIFFVSIGVWANVTAVPQYLFFWLFVLLTVAQYSSVSWAVKRIGNGRLTEQGIREVRLKGS